MSNDNEFSFKLIDVPPEFHSDVTLKPFSNCIKCNKELLVDGERYMIEKAIREDKKEGVKHTIFEYAICMECAQAMSKTLSSDSMINLNSYYANKVNFEIRRAFLKESEDYKDWIRNCMIHNEPPGEMGEYQIYAECLGPYMILNDYPFMIRGEAVDELVELLSAETLDELDNFKNDITSGPPEFREILQSGPRVLI